MRVSLRDEALTRLRRLRRAMREPTSARDEVRKPEAERSAGRRRAFEAEARAGSSEQGQRGRAMVDCDGCQPLAGACAASQDATAFEVDSDLSRMPSDVIAQMEFPLKV